MLSRNLRSTANTVSKNFLGKRSYGSFDRDFYHFANAMTRDFERSMRRGFRSQDLFGRNSSWCSEPVFYEPVFYEPVRSKYEKKTIVSDEDGRIVVKTQRKLPGRPWETYFEEYVNENSLQQGKKPEALSQSEKSNTTKQTAKDQSTPQKETKKEGQAANTTAQQQQQQQTIEQNNPQQNRATEASAEKQTDSQKASDQSQAPNTQQNSANDVLSLFDQQFQEISDSITRDFDTFFGRRSFNPFSNRRWFEPDLEASDHGNTTYRMRTVINNNGNVTVKTVTKDPGSAWKTSVEHYGKEDAIEGDKKTEALGNGSNSEQQGLESEQQASKDQTASH